MALIRCTLFAVFLLPLVPGPCAGAQESARVRELIAHFDMQYLEGESGYFALRPGSEFAAVFDRAQRPIHSSIYYLLTAEKPVNYLHWLASEDVHILVEGGPLDYYLFLEDGSTRHVRLGRDIAAGEVPVVTVPARSYKAIVLAPTAGHALLVNVLTPAWSADRVRIGADEGFIKRYRGGAAWATDAFLRSLLPPAS